MRKSCGKAFFCFFRAQLLSPFSAYPFRNGIFYGKIFYLVRRAVRQIIFALFPCRATENGVCKGFAVLFCGKTGQQGNRLVYSRRIRNFIHKIKLIKPDIKRGSYVPVYIFGVAIRKEGNEPVEGQSAFDNAV